MERSRGFTLVELMIVVAVIAILAGLGMAAFQDSMARAQVAEGIGLASGARHAIAIHHAQTGQFPADNLNAGLSMPASINGRYVRSVTVLGTGSIAVRFSGSASAKIAGETLFLTPRSTEGSLAWSCRGHDPRYLPSSCR